MTLIVIHGGPRGEPVDRVTAIGGGLAFLFILMMALTSFDGAVRWRVLHKVGAHYLAVLFTLDYALKLTESLFYVPPAALVAGAWGVRLAAFAARRRRVKSSAVEPTA